MIQWTKIDQEQTIACTCNLPLESAQQSLARARVKNQEKEVKLNPWRVLCSLTRIERPGIVGAWATVRAWAITGIILKRKEKLPKF